MTNTTVENSKGVISPSQNARTLNTLRLAHLMEEQQRLEIAARITDLRERSVWTQPQIADKLGLTLRGYQKLEEKGTTKYERAQEIAEIHGVDADWVWDGREREPTPDLMGTLNEAELLQQIFQLLAQLGATVDGLVGEVQELKQQLPGSDEESGEPPPPPPPS